MMWTFALITTGLGGMWAVAKHWQGWLLYLVNEVLWFLYALKTDDTALAVMACVWFAIGVRNLVVTRRQAQREQRVVDRIKDGIAADCEQQRQVTEYKPEF